ncbi:MAG: glycosyltransferase [Rickettsiales bacterium]|nr:glycosyltransferase [Rickettsiales bacterium]
MILLFFLVLTFYAILSCTKLFLASLEIRRQKDLSITLEKTAFISLGYGNSALAAPQACEEPHPHVKDRYGEKIDENNITVLQPILGGDPELENCLTQNLKNAPQANFIWLIDDDDLLGQEAAKKAIAKINHGKVKIMLNPKPPQDVNPKTAKLGYGIKIVESEFIAILDDDTILAPESLKKAAAIARSGNLVTGLPIYSARANLLSRLITGFVNSNSILTYLPTSFFKINNTINGMFSLMRLQDINIGDFDKILKNVTDDYALAQIFRNKGLGIFQTIIIASISTTITSIEHYNSLIKRWFIFAKIYLRQNLNLALTFLIILPAILPFFLLILAVLSGKFSLVILAIAVLFLKSLAVHKLFVMLGFKAYKADSFFEIIAEIIMPLQFFLAAIKPQKIVWRKQSFFLNKIGMIKL